MTKFGTVVFFLLCITIGNAQIKVSEIIQPNTISQSQNNKLYFVDFWATWCAPCITAKKYLSRLQKQFANELYIVSITEESPQVVNRLLERKPTDLAIVIDYDGETFREFEIKSLPQGVLFNAKGDKLWRGHSANLSASIVEMFLKRESVSIASDEFIIHKPYKKAQLKNSFELPISVVSLEKTTNKGGLLEIKQTNNAFILNGNLVSLLAYALEVNDIQVSLSADLELNSYILIADLDSFKKSDIATYLLDELNLTIDRSMRQGEFLEFSLDGSKLWDTNQIDWTGNQDNYLISDDELQLDNASLQDVIYRLSNLLELPISTSYAHKDELHDWQIHYKYIQLMNSDLQDSFGIVAKRKTGSIPLYNIRKKTP